MIESENVALAAKTFVINGDFGTFNSNVTSAAPVNGVPAASILTLNGTLTQTGNTNQTGNITLTGGMDASTYLEATSYREIYNDLGTGGSATIDMSTANNFKRTFNGNATITFSNAPAGKAFGFTLITANAQAFTITWPVNVDWAGGSAPILTTSGIDVLVFYTYDGGTTFYGFVVGKNMA